MAGKRHHTIPRFMLKGFASSRRGDEVNVWMYRKDKPGIEVNINNVGVEKHFYGDARTSDLDTRISALETDFALLVDELRLHDSTATEVASVLIPDLVSHLALRTRQFRQSVLIAFDSALLSIKEHFSLKNVVEASLTREFARRGGSLETHLLQNGLPPEKLEKVMELLQPHLLEIVEQLMPDYMAQAAGSLEKYVSTSRSLLPEATRLGFIDSMSRNLDVKQRSASYARYKWFVLHTPSLILLGDTACLFETAGQRRFKPLDDEGDEVQRVYLPLASNRLLVGTRHSSCPLIDVRRLNKAISRCSQEFLISSVPLPSDSPIIKNLGMWSGIAVQISPQE